MRKGLVGPGAGRDDQLLGSEGPIAGDDFHLASDFSNLGHSRLFKQGRTVRLSESPVGGVGASRHRDAGPFLVNALDLIVDPPLRPPAADLHCIYFLELHSGLGHSPPVIVKTDGAFGSAEIEPSGFEDQRLPRVFSESVPSLKRSLRQLHVVAPVIGEANNPAVILRPTASVTKGELFDAQHLGSEAL